MPTAERYTTHDRVNRLLRLPGAFTASTTPTIEQVESLIDQKMDYIDNEVKTSFHLNQSHEYHDVRGPYEYATGVPVFLSYRNVRVPLSGALGDSLKLWNGSTWEEFVGSKTESRASDFWLDETLGILYLKTGYFGISRLKVDVTYRHNSGGRTELSGALTSTGTGTVNVSGGTIGFPMQGSFSISGEEVRYNSKTSSSFNVVERGAYNTSADAQQAGTILFSCPRDITEACTKLVAIDLLTAENYSSGGTISGEIPGGQPSVMDKIESWRKDVEDIFNRYRPALLSTR